MEGEAKEEEGGGAEEEVPTATEEADQRLSEDSRGA